jgi:hypothetical protein
MKTTRTLAPLDQAFIDPEAMKRIGEAFAEIMQADMNTPSFMRVAVEHQQAHPQKSPMQCLHDALPEYNQRCKDAIEMAGRKYLLNPQSAITVNSN